MQYNSESQKQDIVSGIVDWTGQNPTAHIQAITRAANEANRHIWAWIFESYGGWLYDDSNNSTLPTATAALVASQAKYTIPDSALTVRGVEVKDASGNWTRIEGETYEDIRSRRAENEHYDTASQPMTYRLSSNVIELYPAPNYSQSASLRIFFDRGSSSFTTADDTKVPGFASEFHGAVVIGAAYEIAGQKSLSNLGVLQVKWAEYERTIKEYYKARFAEIAPSQIETQRDDPMPLMH